MRTKLGRINDKEKHEYIGKIVRFGVQKDDRSKKTVMLQDICDVKGNLITDHLWFPVDKRMEKAAVRRGDIISFQARVGCYTKGIAKNYNLKDLSNIVILQKTA